MTGRSAPIASGCRTALRAGLLLVLLSAAGCTANEPWRTAPPCTSPDCDRSFLIEHPNYDLAFVEFTERGNLFDRERRKQVVDHVRRLAQSPGGVTGPSIPQKSSIGHR